MTACGRPWLRNCTAETLTAIFMSSGQVAASAQACRSTHSPIALIRPVSSATGMKSAGRDETAFGVVPAQQRLAPAHLIVREPHQRLVVQLELVVDERLAQVDFERAPHLHARVHLGLEIAIGAAAFRLGAIKRHVRAFQELVDLGAIVGREGDADAEISAAT